MSPIQGSQKYSKYTGQALAGLSAKSHSLPLIPNAQSVFSSTHILYSFKSNVPFLASCNKFYITQVNSILLKRSFHSGSLLSDPKDERKILLDEKSKIEEFVDHQRKKRENAKDDTGNIQDQVKDAFIFRADAGAAPAIKEAKVAIPEKPKKPILQRIKDEVIHYYKGFRLLFLDVRVATRMLWQVLNGKTLSRRERKQVSTLSYNISILEAIISVFGPVSKGHFTTKEEYLF